MRALLAQRGASWMVSNRLGTATVGGMSSSSALGRLIRIASDAIGAALRSRSTPGGVPSTPRQPAPEQVGDGADYPGDWRGPFQISYDPHDDGQADPGEVVWAWVPFEEDHARGKDRPALIMGRQGSWLLALQVTSQDHDRDAEQEARAGRYWIDIGVGAWDAQGRASEARVNRVIQLAPHAVRRTGGRLSPERFQLVAQEVTRFW